LMPAMQCARKRKRGLVSDMQAQDSCLLRWLLRALTRAWWLSAKEAAKRAAAEEAAKAVEMVCWRLAVALLAGRGRVVCSPLGARARC
jgi:hypothetical protein